MASPSQTPWTKPYGPGTDLYARLLDTLATVRANEEDARSLWSLWGVTGLTDEERSAFKAALYQDSAVGDYASSLGKRSSTIALARSQLLAASPQSPVQMRRAMYYAENGCPEALKTARCKWIVLQMRQLQRLAFESLLSWCEHKTLKDVHDTTAMTNDLEAAFVDSDFGLPTTIEFSTLLESLNSRASNLDEFLALGRDGELFCPFRMIQKIEETVQRNRRQTSGYMHVCHHALRLLAGCFDDPVRLLIDVGGHTGFLCFNFAND